MNQIITSNKVEKVTETKLTKIIVYLLFGLGPVTGNVILVLFGVLSTEFNVTPNAILISIPAFMIPFAIIQLFSGAISDVKGRFPVIILGLIIFGIGMFTAAASISLLMFIIANILGGIGFGFVNPVLIALITDIIPPGPEIPKKLGYLGAVAAFGVGLGPLIAGFTIQLSWRYLYFGIALIVIMCLVTLFIMKKPPQKKHEDSGVHALIEALKQETKRPAVILMITSAFLISFSYLAIIIWTSRAFTGKIDESLAGILLSLVGAAGAVSGLINGNLIKKIGLGLTLIISLIALFISTALLIFFGDLTRSENVIFVGLALIFAGIAGGILFPCVMYYSQIISPERRGALAGLSTAGYFIGIAFVPMSYEPFFLEGGINLVYSVILLVSILLTLNVGVLYFLAKRLN
jgi:MFS family permease